MKGVCGLFKKVNIVEKQKIKSTSSSHRERAIDLKAFSVSFAHLWAAQIAREWKWNKEGEIHEKLAGI